MLKLMCGEGYVWDYVALGAWATIWAAVFAAAAILLRWQERRAQEAIAMAAVLSGTESIILGLRQVALRIFKERGASFKFPLGRLMYGESACNELLRKEPFVNKLPASVQPNAIRAMDAAMVWIETRNIAHKLDPESESWRRYWAEAEWLGTRLTGVLVKTTALEAAIMGEQARRRGCRSTVTDWVINMALWRNGMRARWRARRIAGARRRR